MAILLLAGVMTPLLPSQEKTAEKPTTTAAAPAAAPDFSKEAYTIERHLNRISAESDGTGSREVTAEVKMLAEAGVKAFAVLSFTYTSANEVVDIDYVRVRKPDGTVVKTPDYNIQDMPGEVTRTAPLYSDIHEKHIAVKGLGVGDVLEYVVRFRTVKALVPGHFWYEYSFIKNGIAKDEQLEISVPKEKYVKVVSPDFKPEIKEEGPRRVYRWKHANLEVKEKDPNEVPRRIPPNPDVQVTTFASWEDVGRWYGGLQKDPLEVTAAIQAKAAELTKGLALDDDKIHAIYNFVSLKYHYVGLDFGIGRYQPHAADDVLDNGYGDCKDKHTLLASLLKAAGIEAWPVLIHSQRKLDPDVPSPAQFNHVITVVPRGGQLLWLDTTPEVAPYGLLLLNLRDKQALMIPTSKPPALETTPQNPPFPEEHEFSTEGKLGPDGTFTGHIEQSYRGDTEVYLRAAFRQVSQSQWKEAVQRFSYGLNFGGDVSNVKMTSPDELDKPFELSYDYVRKNYADWENRQIVAPLPPIGMEIVKGSREKKPLEPLPLGGLGKATFRSRVELPAGYAATAPAKCHLSEPYAEYSDDTRIENGVMTTTRVMVVKKNEIPLRDWDGYHKFGRAVADDEFDYIRLSRTGASVEAKGEDDGDADGGDVDQTFRDGTDAMQRRDFKRAQEIFEKVIAKDPNHKLAHLNLGLALGAQNRTFDALPEFQKEEEISPDDPRAYQAAASLASYLGNSNGAVAEWRKLLKVDPVNRTAATTLAGLLMQQEKYPDAAEVLEVAVKTAPDNPGLQYQLGEAYFKSGQSDKAMTRMKQAVEQKDDDPDMLNNVAYLLAENKTSLDLAKQYAEKAVDEIEDRSRGAESSDQAGLDATYRYGLVWDTLGWIYFQQGDAKRAESLVRAAWLLGEESVVAEHLGEIYGKEGNIQEAAHAYEYALAVSSVPPVSLTDAQKAYKSRSDEIKARYKKLTGKEVPLTEIRRLPNGQWTQTPAEQLRHSREVKLSNPGKLSGKAQFIVEIKPEKVDSVHFVSGDDALKPLEDKLVAAHFPLEFPPDSGAILVLRLDVSCQPTAQCVAALVNPVPERH